VKLENLLLPVGILAVVAIAPYFVKLQHHQILAQNTVNLQLLQRVAGCQSWSIDGYLNIWKCQDRDRTMNLLIPYSTQTPLIRLM
jgi:hypothetical protein